MWVKISLSTNYNFYKLSSELEAVIIAVWVEHDWGEQGRDSSYNSRVVQTESAKFKHCIAIPIYCERDFPYWNRQIEIPVLDGESPLKNGSAQVETDTTTTHRVIWCRIIKHGKIMWVKILN